MSNEIQRRFVTRAAHPVRLQERADGALPFITGYASVFYRTDDPATEYEMWPADSWGPRVVERIMPGAFSRALKEDDVRGLFNHRSDVVLGRSAAGTLRLSVDSVGLRYEIDPPDTQAARDLIQSLRRGDITGSSFAFFPRDSKYVDRSENNKVVETVIERHDVSLLDVGPVTFPAYPGATSGVRSEGDREPVRRELDRRRAARDLDALSLALVLIDCDDD